ncbi:hypothetical protein MTP99_018809 [Tenebrio molitor]|nr:hypothetical protein MTP99_018809 [Tenebrio molitor]
MSEAVTEQQYEMSDAVLGQSFVSYTNYNFENSALELARCQWSNYADQHYLKGCKWSPDGTCLLTVVRGAGMHVMELPTDLYSGETIMNSRPIVALSPAVSVPESGLIYDYCWYPGMNSANPATCCLYLGNGCTVKLWDVAGRDPLETKPSEDFPSFLQVGFLNLPVEDFVDRTLFTVKTH